MSELHHSYEQLERELTSLVGALSDVLSADEQREVVEFADAGEYGLALETLAGILVEEGKALPRSAFRQISSLAESMGIVDRVVTARLANQVLREESG